MSETTVAVVETSADVVPLPVTPKAKPARVRKPRPSRAKKAEPTMGVPVARIEVPTPPAEPTVMEQVEKVFGATWKAQLVALVWGGLVPVMTFVVKKFEYDSQGPMTQVPVLLVLAGLLYSAKKVYKFSQMVFGERTAALGFTVLVEGVMTFSSVTALSVLGLGILVFTNWVAACHHITTKKQTRR